ncbi:hypothetical protein EV359DRAFT_87954 [Lentinula novae-zelandiae]|nr:hypothetical protein EV359DRAFT_87954 [Lentinula novae-zelandiae]
MSTSRTTTQTTSDIGSIPITGGTGNPPPAPTRPTMPSASDKERELEEQLRRDWEQLQRFKEKRKAEEKAKRKAEEEAARRVAEEKKQWEEVAAQAASAKKREEEAADQRRRAAAAGTHQGPSPSEATTSVTQVEVEIPRLVKKGKGRLRNEASGGDPDDGDDGGEDDDDDEERAPCEWCVNKRIPCLEQVGKRSTVICKPCHDAKVKCSYSGRPVQSKREGGPSGEGLAVMESQMAQGPADVRSLREATTRTNQYLHQILRKQEEMNGRLIAIETRLSMAGSATPGLSRTASEKPRLLKRKRIEEETEEEEKEEEEEEKEDEEEVEGEAPAPKKVGATASEKGKERAE